jgi:hypothetical protein
MDENRRRKLERRRALLIRRNELLAQRDAENQKGGIDKFNEFMERHAAPIPAGLLQGGLDAANFFGNLIPGALGLETIPKADVAGTFLKPGYNKTSFAIGEFGPLLASLVSGGSHVGRKVLESDLAKKLGTALSSEKTGKSLLNKYLTKEGASAEEFQNIFKEAAKAESPLLNLKFPEKDLKLLKKAVGPEIIESYMKNPTAEAGHFLRSKLNQYAKKVEKAGSKAHPSYEARATKAKDYAEKLRNSINESLLKAGEEFPGRYSAARAGFKENVVPFRNVKGNFFENAALEPGAENYIFPRRLPQKTLQQGGDPLVSALMQEMPELKLYEQLRSDKAKLAGKAAGGIAGTYLGSHYLKHLLKD